MKTNPYTVKLPSIGLRSPEHEVFARDPAVRREIAMLPIRVGDEATLKASGLRFRIACRSTSSTSTWEFNFSGMGNAPRSHTPSCVWW